MRFISKTSGVFFAAIILSQYAMANEPDTLEASKYVADKLLQGMETGYADIDVLGRCRIQINSKEYAHVSDEQECFEALEHVMMDFHMADLTEYEMVVVQFRNQYGY